ncbi:MAG: hypothetical protein ACFE0O_04645 [Opitutales bacterium]
MRFVLTVLLLLIGVAQNGLAAGNHDCCSAEAPEVEDTVFPDGNIQAISATVDSPGQLTTCATEACTCASCACCFSAGQSPRVPADLRVQERWQPVHRIVAELAASPVRVRSDCPLPPVPTVEASARWSGAEHLIHFGQRLL